MLSIFQNEPVAIIAVAGAYWTGKSYLMNKLFLKQLKEQRKKSDPPI